MPFLPHYDLLLQLHATEATKPPTSRLSPEERVKLVLAALDVALNSAGGHGRWAIPTG